MFCFLMCKKNEFEKNQNNNIFSKNKEYNKKENNINKD